MLFELWNSFAGVYALCKIFFENNGDASNTEMTHLFKITFSEIVFNLKCFVLHKQNYKKFCVIFISLRNLLQDILLIAGACEKHFSRWSHRIRPKSTIMLGVSAHYSTSRFLRATTGIASNVL